MTVTCPRCGITSPTFRKAAVARPRGLANRMLKKHADAWLALSCFEHAKIKRREKAFVAETRHWSSPGSWVVEPGKALGSGPFVLRSDCDGGDCCDGTELWLRAREADGKYFFTSTRSLAWRFETIEAARAEREKWRTWFRAWKKAMGYFPRATKKMKIMRRRK